MIMSKELDDILTMLRSNYVMHDSTSLIMGWKAARDKIIKILETNEIAYHKLTTGGQIEEIERL